MLVFPLAAVPEMARGKGVRLQSYKDGGLSDARVFAKADGLSWTDRAGRLHTRPRGRAEGLARRARAGRPLAAAGLSEIERLGSDRGEELIRLAPYKILTGW